MKREYRNNLAEEREMEMLYRLEDYYRLCGTFPMFEISETTRDEKKERLEKELEK